MGIREAQDTWQAHLWPGGILQQHMNGVTGITGMDTVSCHISMSCQEGHNSSLLVLGFAIDEGSSPILNTLSELERCCQGI